MPLRDKRPARQLRRTTSFCHVPSLSKVLPSVLHRWPVTERGSKLPSRHAGAARATPNSGRHADQITRSDNEPERVETKGWISVFGMRSRLLQSSGPGWDQRG